PALTHTLCHRSAFAVPYRPCAPPTGDAGSSTSVSIPTPYSGTCQLGALYPLLSSVSAPVYVALALGQNVTPTVSLCPTGTVSPLRPTWNVFVPVVIPLTTSGAVPGFVTVTTPSVPLPIACDPNPT